ncbi:ead/Ea22-like family protein [Klebsiella aerogenes]|uniref:ead/Ea22-like family protein n=1 Tax=Klebsiella aerogenes TaxID=548 RepID=UPI001BCDA544|nr:ead/Ea22-like family protein [Klebsiella aerogenes]
MNDITELAQSLKAAAEKWQEAWGKYDKVEITIAEFIRAANQYESIVKDPANILALVEALEKAQQHIARQEQILLNKDESLSIRRGELEAAQQERENWRTSFDNERFRADKLKAHIDDIEPVRAAAEKLVRCKGRYHSEQNYRALAALFGVTTPDLPPLDSESRTVTVKLPDDEDGQAYGFGKWANGKLPATAGTMTIAYCEDAWRAAFEVFSSAAGIKVEGE